MKTRDRILDAMFRLVSEHGYEKTTISMICRDLNINKPSIYYCFESKEDILITLFDEYVYDFLDIRLTRKAGNTYKEDLIAYGYKMIDSFKADEAFLKVSLEYSVQAQRLDKLKTKVQQFQKKFDDVLYNVLKEGVDSGEFQIDIRLNTQILSAILQSVESALVYGIDYDSKAMWRECIERLYR